jgi:glycosyltransferase involved in cell wall biosynthesis
MPSQILCLGDEWFPHKPSGLSRYTYELAHQLASNHDRVYLAGFGLPEVSAGSSLQLINLGAPNSSLVKRLWFTHQKLTDRSITVPDAVNVNFALYGVPILKNFQGKVPITLTFHGPWAMESAQEGDSKFRVRLKYFFENRFIRGCDRFIVLSKAFGAILHQDYKVPWRKIHIIPGGVDITHFSPTLSSQQARSQLNWPSDKIILFTPRRLVSRMGIDTLLTSLKYIKQIIPDIWLAIAGRGPLRPILELQAKEQGLSNHVTFLGYLPDELLPIAYQAADLTVVPSQVLEGFGLILVESLACGTPVVCTPVGGMPEILEPLNPHLITQSPDEKAISACLLNFLKDNLELPSQEACREYAVTNFDWNLIAPKIRQTLLS